jgi:hypothetical protein
MSQTASKPVPIHDTVSATFFDGARDGKLMLHHSRAAAAGASRSAIDALSRLQRPCRGDRDVTGTRTRPEAAAGACTGLRDLRPG